MLKNVKIMKKILMGFGFMVAINIIVGIMIFSTVSTLNQTSDENDRLLSATEYVQLYHVNAEREHNLLMDFLNSGDVDLVTQIRESMTKTDEIKDKSLESLKEFDPKLAEDINTIDALLTEWENSVLEKQLEQMQSPETSNMARAQELSPNVIKLLEKIEHGFENLMKDIDHHHDEALAKGNKLMDIVNASVVISSIVLILISVGAALFFRNIIVTPLQEMVSITERLRNRDWNVTVTGTERGDEIGLMANSLEIFRTSGIESDRLKAEQDKQDQIKLERTNKIEQLVNGFEGDIQQLMNDLAAVAEEMQTTSQSLNTVVEITNEKTTSATILADRAGANIQNVASATEELTISINEISKQLQDANRNSSQAQETVTEAVGYIRNLEASAIQISDIIRLINEIAEQTNLLALNATIESARAGEAGKGFSVVASEVKNLATETAKATEEISQKIQALQNETTITTQTVSRIASMVNSMNEAATTVASTMEEQSVATQDIARNISEVAQGTSEVSSNLNSVNDNTKATEEAAGHVLNVSEKLKEQSERLQKGVYSFIQGIRAA